MKLQPVRGTKDYFGEVHTRCRHIQAVSERIARYYGYASIMTPIFEDTRVFQRTLGETSDIVGKEMYTFTDRGGDQITLRPEGTASVVRAVISNGLAQTLPQKLICSGPMFRYERPQKGRFRQFHQVSLECIGIHDPLIDVETIAMGHQILAELGLMDRVVLELNTLGDTVSRTAYRAALVEALTPYKAELSEDSQRRLLENPLRILDSKNPKDQEVIQGAPAFNDFLSKDSHVFFARVCEGLTRLNIPFKHNPRLVRGLDYYCHTAFEFTVTDLGAQNALLAGGRYDGLVKQMGGPDLPGIGWALGIDRTALMLKEWPALIQPSVMVPIGPEMFDAAFSLMMALRREHALSVTMGFSGNLSKRLKQAHKNQAPFALILGEDEHKSREIMVRNLETGQEETVQQAQLGAYLKEKQKAKHVIL